MRTLPREGGESAWSAALPIAVLARPLESPAGSGNANAPAQVTQRILTPLTWLRQRKDTTLLCIDGDDEAPLAGNAWDRVHPDAIFTHGRNNCVRASIAIMVTQYGASLSQDRIAYEYFERNGNPIRDFSNGTAIGNPHADLGHDLTTIMCGSDGASGGVLFAWALGIAQGDIGYGSGKPTFAQVRGSIDADRPIMAANDPAPGVTGHMRVIGGYRILGDGSHQVRVFDPWSGESWQTYASFPVGCRYVPPASAPNARSDEAAIAADTDGDGIMILDEQMRFGTSQTSVDSDGDWVRDKADLREYVFDSTGSYALRNADSDLDGLRKERDADNDGDGFFDGCEDLDGDGRYEPAAGETTNFVSNADGFEPNDSEGAAAALTTGTFAALIAAGDVDYFRLVPNDFVDIELDVEYPPAGAALYAELDQVSASEPTAGTLLLDQALLAPGSHFLSVWGRSSAAANCYVATLALQAATIAPDRFDDQQPPGELRNDSFATRTLLPADAVLESVLVSSSVDALNFEVSNDVDHFDLPLPPATNPYTGQSECLASPPGDPSFYQGFLEIRAHPLAKGFAWPFEFTAFDATGTALTSASGGSLYLECPHEDFGDHVRFSVRAHGGRRNFYDLSLHYTRWNALLDVPPWLFDLVQLPFLRVPPPEAGQLIQPVLFPTDPDDYARVPAW